MKKTKKNAHKIEIYYFNMIDNNRNSQPGREEPDTEPEPDYTNIAEPEKSSGETVALSGMGWSISLTSQRVSLLDLLNLTDRIYSRYFGRSEIKPSASDKQKGYLD